MDYRKKGTLILTPLLEDLGFAGKLGYLFLPRDPLLKSQTARREFAHQLSRLRRILSKATAHASCPVQ